MQQRPPEQLDKVLALADSSHDGEALVAVRMARAMLSRNGLNFSDLAKAATRRPPFNKAFSFFATPPLALEAELIQMQQKLDDAKSALDAQTRQTEHWRRRTKELEMNVSASQSETERWRQLARDTVEKLWDLGEHVRAESLGPDAPSSVAAGSSKIA